MSKEQAIPSKIVVPKTNDELDRLVRVTVYERFLEHGYPPSAYELASTFDREKDDVMASFARLSESRALILNRPGDRVIVAPPFSAVPTPFWVKTPRGAWWGNCAWEALGIAALLETDARIRTTSGATGEPLLVVVDSGRVGPENVLVHFTMPVHRWWEDVRFTCATLLFFRSRGEIDAWSQDHGLPRGEEITLSQCWTLARTWFMGRFDPDWKRLTPEEAKKSFEEVGLQGDFWKLH